MIKKLSMAVVSLMAIYISGCTTPPKGTVVAHNTSTDLQRIQIAKSEILEKIKTGMSFYEFHQLVPEAYLTAEHNEMKAYEMAYEQKYVNHGDIAMQNLTLGLQRPATKTYKQVLWFYFYQDHLVKWGRPEDWPPKSEIEGNDSAAASSEK
jgi:hypothetical protein